MSVLYYLHHLINSNHHNMTSWRLLCFLVLFGAVTLSAQFKDNQGFQPLDQVGLATADQSLGLVPVGIALHRNNSETESMRMPNAHTSTVQEEINYPVPTAVAATLELSTTSLTMDAAGGSASFDITSNTTWKVYESLSWLSVTPGNGANNGTVTVTVLPRTTSSGRSGTITVYGTGVSSKRITITQSGLAGLSVTPNVLSFSAAGADNTFAITSSASWTIAEDADWLSVTPTSGTGNAVITVSVLAHTGVVRRSEKIEVAVSGVSSRSVEVYQEGIPATLSISTAATDFTAMGGVTNIAVTSNTSWKVTESLSWISVTPSTGTGDGAISINCQINTSEIPRTGTITLAPTAGTGAVTQVIAVSQLGASSTIAVSPASFNIAAEGGTSTLALTSMISWLITEAADWLEVNPPMGTGDATISISALANLTTQARTATITVTGEDGTFRTVSVTQAGATPVLTVAPESMEFTTTGGTADFIVASNTTWAISGYSSWLSVSTSSGSQNASITLTCQPNTSTSARTTEVRVSGGNLSRKLLVTQQGVPITLTASPTALTFTAEAGNKSISISSNANWSVSENLSWLSVTPSSGKLNGTVTVTCQASLDQVPRSGEITIAVPGATPQIIAVTQAAYSISLGVNPSTLSFSPSGGTSNVGVTASVDWSVSETADWLDVSALSGTGNASLSIICSQNTSTSPRNTIVTLTGADGTTRTVSVTQSGITPTLSATPASVSLAVEGGTSNLSILSNTAWSIQTSAEWLSFSTLTGAGDGSVVVTALANSGTSARSAVIFITAAGTSPVSVTVTQAGSVNTPYLTVAPTLLYAPASAGSISFQIESNTTWRISESISWATVSPASGSSNGEVTVTLTARTSTSSRSGTIYIYGTGLSSKKVTITQYGTGTGYTLSVSPGVVDFSEQGGVTNVLVASNTSWKVSSDEKWLTLSGSAGSNNGTFTITCQPNTSTSPRNASIEVSGTGVNTQTIRVTQLGIQEVLSVTPSMLEFSASGATSSFAIASNTEWTVSESLSWLSVSPNQGSLNGSVTVVCTLNPDPIVRTGTITITGKGGLTQTVEVTQGAASLTLQVSPTTLGYTAAGGTSSLSITSSIDWTLAEIEDWIELSATSGTGNASVVITCLPNTTTSPRSMSVVLTGADGTEIIIQVTQGGVLATLTVSPASLSYPIEGGVSTVQITTNTN